MIYEVYETDAFVLASRPSGESDRLFRVLSRDFGLIFVIAKNIRSESSKLRYNLQPLSRVHVSLVKGREYWRVVGVRDAEHFFFGETLTHMQLIKRTFDLLTRLIRGEGANDQLFLTLDGFFRELRHVKNDVEVKALELIAVARLLHTLGYFSSSGEYQFLFSGESSAPFPLQLLEGKESGLIRDINAAITESQL